MPDFSVFYKFPNIINGCVKFSRITGWEDGSSVASDTEPPLTPPLGETTDRCLQETIALDTIESTAAEH